MEGGEGEMGERLSGRRGKAEGLCVGIRGRVALELK